MDAKPYPTDLTDAEWEWIKELIPHQNPVAGVANSICVP
jgi:hypothetical protein